MIRTSLAGVCAALCISGAAAAQTVTVSTAPLYSGSAGASVLCYTSNYNAKSVSVSGAAILNDLGTESLPLYFNSCLGKLARGQGCAFLALIPQPANHAFACGVAVAGTAKTAANMRLTLEMRATDQSILVSETGH